MKETESEQSISKFPQKQKVDERGNSRTWNVVREYEGCFSAERAIEEMIRVHIGEDINWKRSGTGK